MGPRLLLICAAVLFSTGGAAIKWNDLTNWQVACFRSGIAGLIFWVALPTARRRWTPALFAVGCAYAATQILFVAATKLTTAANAIFLQSTAPAYLLIIGPVFLKESLRRSDLALLAGTAVGMSLFFISAEAPQTTAPDPVTGNLLAAASGATWAIVIAGLRWAGRNRDNGDAGHVTVFIGSVIAFLATLGPALPAADVNLSDVLTIVYLGTCQTALAYVCLTKAMREVPAFEAAATMLVEPALNPMWAWLTLGERPGVVAAVGGAIVLLATSLNSWWQATRRSPARAES